MRVLVTGATGDRTSKRIYRVEPPSDYVQLPRSWATISITSAFIRCFSTIGITSDHAEGGVLDVKIQARSVNTGPGL